MLFVIGRAAFSRRLRNFVYTRLENYTLGASLAARSVSAAVRPRLMMDASLYGPVASCRAGRSLRGAADAARPVARSTSGLDLSAQRFYVDGQQTASASSSSSVR